MKFKTLFRKKKKDVCPNRHYPGIEVNYKRNYCQESDFDENDYYVSSGEQETTKDASQDLRSICPPIRNQKTLGSCASHGAIACYESELIKQGRYIEMSELYHYYNARVVDGNQLLNVGMTLRQACATLKKEGLSFEQYWPYTLSKYKTKPSFINYWVNKLLNRMTSYNVKAYYFVKDTPDAIMWLDKKTVVMAGIRMFPEFNKAYGKELLTMKDIEGVKNLRIYGGHCVRIVGYDAKKQTLLIGNSWGKYWGTKGYIEVSYDLWEKICFEMRVITT